MILLSYGYLVTHPRIPIFALLVVFVMSIFPNKNAPSSQLNLLNVLFLVIQPTKKDLCAMILIYIGFGCLEMSFFKKIHIFLYLIMTLSLHHPHLFCHCFLIILQ